MTSYFASYFSTVLYLMKVIKETKEETIADWLHHVNSSFVHFASPLQILFKESQAPEQSTVILQDLYVVRHIAVHLKVLLSLQV